jgi:hypothetical protein
MDKFRLDRTAFSATNAKDANNRVSYWENKTYAERLEAAFYLIYKSYGIDPNTRIDKNFFAIRKR